MIIFGDHFLELRDKYIIPLIEIKVPVNKYKFWEFKNILINKVQSVEFDTSEKFILSLNKDDFLKSMFVDIDYFIIRSMVQYADVKICMIRNSVSWQFITTYYLLFFSATALFRIMQSGFIFLNEIQSNKLSSIITAIAKTTYKIKPGNYFFKSISEESNLINIEFYQKSKGLHEHTWNYLSNLIDIFYLKSNSDEKVILNRLKEIKNNFQPAIASNIRNIVNYQGNIGISELRKEFSFIFNDDINSYVRKLINNDLNESFQNQMTVSTLYGYYFFLLNLRLYNELIERNGQGAVKKLRKDYFLSKKIKLPDL